MTFVTSLNHASLATELTPAASPSATNIARIEGQDAVLAALRALGANACSSAFQNVIWLETWLETIARVHGFTPVLMVATEAGTNAFQMALPLVKTQSGGITRLEAMDFGLADYVGPLFAPDFQPDAATMNQLWKALIAALPRADMLALGKIPTTIAGRANPLMLVEGIHRHRQSAWGTPMSKPPLDFAALGMPKKRIRELNNRWKRLEALGTVRFHMAETTEEKDRFFAILCQQRSDRFRALNRPNSLDKPSIRAFFRKMLDTFDGKTGAVIQVLSVNDEVIATGLGLIDQTAFHMIFPTIAGDEWRPYSPGLQHFRKSMEVTCAAGLGYYDFTLGSETYKAEFGATEMKLYEIIQPLTAKGGLVSAGLAARRFIHARPALVRTLRRISQTLNVRSK